MSVPSGTVIVLGGGPAGLAAARELSSAGVHVIVLERAPWVGGLSFTHERDDFRFDLGGHRWFTKNTWLHNWFLELMRDELVTVDRISRIYFGGRYFDYRLQHESGKPMLNPDRDDFIVAHIGLQELRRIVLEGALLAAHRSLPDNSACRGLLHA